MEKNGMLHDDAVSESIGFVLIFSLVMVGIGLVTLYGYPVLLKQQASADQRIMEKNMIVLQNDIKGLCYKSVPFKETSLKVGGGSLTVFNESLTPQVFEILDNGVSIYTFRPGELRFETLDQGMVVTIENGAVIFRQYGSAGSTVLAEPRWFYDAPTLTSVIYLIGINSTELLGQTGVGTVQLELAQTNYTQYNSLSGHTITVKYTPDPANDYSTAWGSYFTNTLDYTYNVGLGGYDLPPTDILVIKRYDVMVRSL
jgi:hypothetical protein